MRHTKTQLQQLYQLRTALQPPSQRSSPMRYAKGFGLLEVMLFVFVVASFLAVGYAWLTVQQQSVRAQERTAILQQANRFVEAFTAANNRLPCPASNLNGVEDCVSANAKGYLPYRTINFDASQLQRGVGQLRYLVSRSMTKQRDLASSNDPLNAFEPAKWDDTLAAPSTFAFNQVTTADYCRSLTKVGIEATVVDSAGVGKRVAYAIADSGSGDEDSDGSVFDGLNADLSTA